MDANWTQESKGMSMSEQRKLRPGMTRERSGKIRIRYTDPTGQRRSGGAYSTLALADKALRRIHFELESGTWINPDQSSALNSKTTLREVAEQFRQVRRNASGRPLAPNTLHEYRRYLEVVVPHLADKPIASITEHDIEKWWSVDSKRCPTQTSKVYSHLKSVFAYAQKKKIIRENPCDIEGASKYVPEKQPEIPTRSQVDIFLENSSPEFALIIALASMGGLRKHEILDLRKGDIIKEEIAGEVYYSVSITKGVSWVNGVPVSRIPKTAKSIRRVELPQAINRYLAKHLTQVAIHDEALLFPTSPFTPEIHFSKHQLQRTWEKIRAVAGYRGRFHSLRGYALTRYAQRGATTQELMDLGGHSDIKIALSYQRSTGRQRELMSNW